MHLREVHMENFKSFGRKLSVPFEPGFTGVTGPNGSGKSNIGDAILFVLGPNSPRAMRAGRLSDLIFNGGEKGKGANHCTVSLTFDNADRTMPVEADTVTLTRRIKRAPNKENPENVNSYFYVNGRASQKKEFVDLLNHARISADGYNITQQGDVQKICNMTPMSRREILDNIAGITTFDKDINEANKRRDSVLANLERIGIVLDELQRSLDQLDKEKGAAVRYRELQELILTLKGKMAWRRHRDLQDQIAQVQAQIEEYSSQRAKREEELGGLKERTKEAQSRFAEIEAQIRAEGGEEVQKIQADMEAARDRMVRLEEKINFAKEEIAGHKESVTPLQEELRRVTKELERTKKQREEAAKEHETAKKENEAAKKELDGLREIIGKSDAGAMEVNRQLAKLKHDHEKAQLALHERRLERDRLGERLAAAEKAEKAAAAEHEAVGKDAKEAAWQQKELLESQKGVGKERKDLEKRLLELRKEQAELASQEQDLEQRIRRLQREAAELRAAQDAAERAQGGFGRAVQAILKARDDRSIKGIIGTISELGKVKKEHETALQIAAGPRLQAIVVEDDGVAAQCIDLLKRSGAGRATFMPLSKMVPGRPRGQALMKVKQEGCLGFALDLVTFNARYQNAFWHVFGDTLVATDMGAGRRMMGGVRIVTLDGELFETSGAMTGGTQKASKEDIQFSNADRGRIDEVMVNIAEAESAQQEARERIQAVRLEAEATSQKLSADGHAATNSEERGKELEKKLAKLKQTEETLAKEMAAAEKARSEADKALAACDRAITDLEQNLEAMEAERKSKGELLLARTGKDVRAKVQAAETRVQELTEAVTRLTGRVEVADKQIELVSARQAEVEAQLEAKTGGQGRHKEDIERYSKEHAKAKAEVDALMKMERKAAGALKGLHDEKEKVYKTLVDLQGKMDLVSDRMETQFGLIQNAKAKLPALEESLGEAMVEMKESPVEIKESDDVPPYDELRKDLRNQEQALERLGPVNMRALEEFEEQDKRKKDLQSEVERLQGQKGELEKLVAEISEKKKGAFMEVFEAINKNFSEVYAKISMGGKAYMELDDAKDPFAGGLQLKAQPVGKRVLRLDALSGGEKSLTSMAFIFAIQNYDPSPFYYFDEVDQNLDAVNSELLAKMIREQSRFAQFILVSLRKITLKEAQHLYGVTQSQPGQSEIIANFDLDVLKDEGDDGGDAGPPAQPPAESPRPAARKEPDKPEETIGDVVEGMLEVKATR